MDSEKEMQDVEFGEIKEPTINITLGDIKELVFNIDEFKRGVKDISYVAGKIAGLISVGIPAETAIGYIDGIEECNISANASVEVAKISSELSNKITEKQLMDDMKNSI